MEGIILDLIVLAILALCIFLGYKRGLVKVAFHLVAFILSIIATILLYQPITNWVIENTTLEQTIESKIMEKEEQKDSNNKKEELTNKVKTDITNMTADTISHLIISIGVGIALFVIIRIVLFIIGFLVDGLASFPIIKQLNNVGGVAYGILEGAFIIYVILAIIFCTSSIIPSNIVDTINESTITKFLYYHNIFVLLLFK